MVSVMMSARHHIKKYLELYTCEIRSHSALSIIRDASVSTILRPPPF